MSRDAGKKNSDSDHKARTRKPDDPPSKPAERTSSASPAESSAGERTARQPVAGPAGAPSAVRRAPQPQMSASLGSRRDGNHASAGAEPLQPLAPSADEIARRAYALYEKRGRGDGGDVDDWLQAERELRRES